MKAIEEMDNEKKRRTTKCAFYDRTLDVVVGIAKLRRFGDSWYIIVPKEFVARHHLKKGDPMYYIGDDNLTYRRVGED